MNATKSPKRPRFWTLSPLTRTATWPSFFLAVTLLAQEPGFRVQTRLVLVPALVTTEKGQPQFDFEADRFTLLDNGVPQAFTVDSFGDGIAPIALVVAVQNSGISASALAKVRKIGAMIQPLITGERGCAALLTFAESVQWRQECTKDPIALSRAFAAIDSGANKQGHLLDAVNEAIIKLAARPTSRKVILLISESRDRGSQAKLEPILLAAQKAGVAIYAATYSAFRTGFVAKPEEVQQKRQTSPLPIPSGKPNFDPVTQTIPSGGGQSDIFSGIGELARLGQTKTTEALARATGGTEFPFTKLTGLENAIEHLGEEMHSQFVFSFTPKDAAPGFHQITIQIKGGEKLRIRARPGYWVN